MAGTEAESLKLKLKSARKLKLSREIELCKTRDSERFLNEELAVVKAENEFLEAQLQDLKTQIAQARYQISMIEICSSSEKSKTEAHINNLESYRKGFQDIFDKDSDDLALKLKPSPEQIQHELRVKEQQDKEAADNEMMRQKEKELAEKRQQEAKDVAAIEAECDAVERECAVLEKRNNAIMLKLRRKLLESESTRRELMKRNADNIENVE